jgi:hypothetical protein
VAITAVKHFSDWNQRAMPDRAVPLFVPINATRVAGVVSIRTARLPEGVRTGLAFTSLGHLIAAMGEQQSWTSMCEAALHAALTPVGVDHVQVDAEFVGPAVRHLPGPAAKPLTWTASAHAVA